MGTTDDTSKKRPARKPAASNVSAETPHITPTTLFDQHIERERRRLLQVHSVLHCLYEVLLYAEGEDSIMYAEAAHLAAMMVDESATQLDSMSMKPLIDALNVMPRDKRNTSVIASCSVA